MNKTTPHWIAIALLSAALIAIALKFIVLGSTEKADDGRTAILLTQSERQAVLGEMRMLLEANQQIIKALANDDMPAIIEAVKPVGSGAIHTMDFALKAKLPLEFKQLGFATHYAFDDLARMAAEGKPAREIQLALAKTMNNCIACHASYQLPEAAK